MTLVADESVAQAIIKQLRQDGHTIAAVGELTPGASDAHVLSEADKTGSILLTEDKDFGEMVYRGSAAHRGVVLIRLAGLSRTLRASLVSKAFQDHAAEFDGVFTVITPGGIRIRPANSTEP